ncbi:MAG: hypothetical protein H8D97_00255 [Proteobacteria bacterium]|nr:hypothetical protein [Pseudomonadota bacterium]
MITTIGLFKLGMNIVSARIKKIPGIIKTYGYITKSLRVLNNISKSHLNDAFIIAGGDNSTVREEKVFEVNFKRCNNRSLQKNRKGYDRSIRRVRYPLQPKDMVKYNNNLYRVVGTQNLGKYVKIRNEKLGKDIVKSIKNITLLFHQKSMIFN